MKTKTKDIPSRVDVSRTSRRHLAAEAAKRPLNDYGHLFQPRTRIGPNLTMASITIYTPQGR